MFTTMQNNISITNSSADTMNIQERIKEFIRVNKPFLYILTPCYGSLVHLGFLTSLMNTIRLLQDIGMSFAVEFGNGDSLVSRSRNNLIAKAMTNPEMTHVIFIDNDISWDPMSIISLLLADKHIVGGIYPLKMYDWNKLLVDPQNPNEANIVKKWLERKNNSQLKTMMSDTDFIQHNMLRYNFNFIDPYMNIQNNLAKIKHLATGFMMIKRDMLEKMMQAFPSTKYTDDTNTLKHHENKYAYALFDCGVEDDHYLSEDWMFCSRWRKMGGDIWMDVSVNLTHTGNTEYKGSLIASMV